MTRSHFDGLLAEFEQLLDDCRQLYRSSAELCARNFRSLIPGSPEQFAELMEDLHKGVLIKTYVSVVQADTRWSTEEKRLAERLFRHLWPGGAPTGKLRETANHVFREAGRLKWLSLVRPFQQITPLQDRAAELESLVQRMALAVARADGEPTSHELAAIRSIQLEIALLLRPIGAEPSRSAASTPLGSQEAARQFQQESRELRDTYTIEEPACAEQDEPPGDRLADALASLDELIGLQQVKQDVGTLANFLKMQQQRVAAGLPETKLSLHMVFAGNPGTGKTTVARIVGRIYGAMRILSKGHLVETDRTGLVAEYAGQTGPKTNKKIDEALDGILFIDEAYSLVDESGDDPYGREALQTLLKRMEDDRGRLVVILAGYSGEMDRLLRANPGLTSRFTTHLTFADYSPAELGRIFGRFCQQNHYDTPADTRLRILLGLDWLYRHRDERFGNARLVRNLFEGSIRRLANRIAGISPLDKKLLTTLQPEDVALPGVPEAVLREAGDGRLQLRFHCPSCGAANTVPANDLARPARCQRCQTPFGAEWGEVEPAGDSR